jgi:hypothetical protein
MLYTKSSGTIESQFSRVNELGEFKQQSATNVYGSLSLCNNSFSVLTVYSNEVRDKIVVDDLIKHALENYNFELKTVAYRRGHDENNVSRILIFVENSESFVFLHDRSNWPTTLAGHPFTTRSPSIPPQLALVLSSVSLQIDCEDFVQELKDKYPDLANIIRLKNKAQQPVRAVKLEFLSSKLRNEILDAGKISIMHMKLKVVE